MSKKLLFGTAGIPHSTGARDSESGIERAKELGLGAMELEFVRGVHMKADAAREVGKAGENEGISLSVHAPYFVNLNSPEREKVKASKERILASARVGHICGAKIAVFHPAFYQGMNPGDVYERVKKELEEMADKLRKEKNNVLLGLETTGKHSAFGNLDETMSLSKEINGVAPCIDFAHLYARSNGTMRSGEDFYEVLEKIEEYGKNFLKDLHMHVSGMNYTAKGERNHLNMEDSGNKFDYKNLLKALNTFDVKGTIICESPNLERDALLMKKYWDKL